MFSPEDRAAVRDALVKRAHEDDSVSAAAFVGSAATGSEDDWSDIDVALKLAPDTDVTAVAQAWTTVMYADHAAAHHFDLWRGNTLFRVFLLADSLQVDLSFWPGEDFHATGPAFRLLFGEAGQPRPTPPPVAEHLVGMGWLYASHVRSALARGRLWQAVHMLDGLRDQVIALACVRHGLPSWQGRGVDRLPRDFTEALRDTRAPEVEPAALRQAFAAALTCLLREADLVDPDLAARLTEPATELCADPRGEVDTAADRT